MKPDLAPEISIFLRVVELGSFAAVAGESDVTPSGVSRTISRLERSLGCKLFHRSTRRLILTTEGDRFLVHARAILETLEIAEAEISSVAGVAKGKLLVNTGSAFAHHKLVPALPGFTQHYPDISVDLKVTDRRIDPFEEQADITIRVGKLADSDLVAIPLGNVTRIIAASPVYIKRHGLPAKPDDLSKHNCLLLSGFPHQATWPFLENGKRKDVRVSGRFTSDSAETLFYSALAGEGIVRLGDFLGAASLASGRLMPLLEDTHVGETQAITALVPPGRQMLPRVRVMLEFLKSLV